MRKLIVDLDGTLALDQHRSTLHLHQQCPECGGAGAIVDVGDPEGAEPCAACMGKGKIHRWNEYFDLCHLDVPNTPIVQLVRELYGSTEVHIFSGRSATVRDKTQGWLDKHGILYDELRLRPEDERMDDHKLKLKWAEDIKDRVWLVIEDRQRVVDAWRAAGYTCLQVAPGAF